MGSGLTLAWRCPWIAFRGVCLVGRPLRAYWIGGVSTLGLTEEQTVACLSATTGDVYLNDTAYWRNVPASVWDYILGGYQVIKKWLGYREYELLGRALTADEAREVTHMERRIATIVLLYPALDAHYLAVK